MTPTHVTKQQVRYRYYISAALGQKDGSGSVTRVPAADIEAAVVKAIRDRLGLSTVLEDQDVIATHLNSLRLTSNQLVIVINQSEDDSTFASEADHVDTVESAPITLTVDWNKTSSKRHSDHHRSRRCDR